jgi:hypothetical protein
MAFYGCILHIRHMYSLCNTCVHLHITLRVKSRISGNRGELYHRKKIWKLNTETQAMTKENRPASTLAKNAEVLHTLYGLLDSDREPTDQDAQSLRYLYASS